MSKLRVATLVFFVGMVAVGVTACSSNNSEHDRQCGQHQGRLLRVQQRLGQGGVHREFRRRLLERLEGEQGGHRWHGQQRAQQAIEAQAQAIINAARKAVANNSTSGLNLPSLNADGAALDTYCGVQGDGTPLYQ